MLLRKTEGNGRIQVQKQSLQKLKLRPEMEKKKRKKTNKQRDYNNGGELKIEYDAGIEIKLRSGHQVSVGIKCRGVYI